LLKRSFRGIGIVWRRGASITYEEELDLPVGRRCFQTGLIPIREGTGRIYRILGVALDVTERKRVEDALQESKAKFQAFYDLGLVGLTITS
jgi:PAS domain-containing protein